MQVVSTLVYGLGADEPICTPLAMPLLHGVVIVISGSQPGVNCEGFPPGPCCCEFEQVTLSPLLQHSYLAVKWGPGWLQLGLAKKSNVEKLGNYHGK